jgi:hypothetical protein
MVCIVYCKPPLLFTRIWMPAPKAQIMLAACPRMAWTVTWKGYSKRGLHNAGRRGVNVILSGPFV